MDRNGQVRKEPTLADLEAFEKLLRDSLQAEPAKDPVLAAPAPAYVPPPDIPANDSADRNAMAELTRLIETPVEFDPPLRGAIAPTPPAPTPVGAPQPDFAPATEHHLHGSAEAALTHDWKPSQTVEAGFAPAPAPHPVAPAPLDPLAAFEEELRRFDAIRAADHAAPAAQAVHEPVAAPVAAAYPQTEYAPYHDTPRAETPIEGNWYQQAEQQQPDYTAESQAESSLNAAEERLAAEAAAGAAAAGTTPGGGRSKGIFLALGGIAVAGLAVIGGSFVLGSGKKGGSSGDVPTITAKTEPTKEKPADPGGMEIPNQNKQVLAARNTPETKPAAVVNTTEQPLDLNQVTKRESVRIIAPNPFQGAQSGVTPTTPAPSGDPAAAVPASAPAGAPVEPRRVQSIRIPVGGGDAAPAAASAPVTTSPPMGAIAAGTGATARSSTPPPVVPRAIDSNGAQKIETRPVTAQPRAETPKVAPPKVATAPATPAAPKATPPKTANAPLSLNPPKTKAPASGGSGGFAIQLASRPTEADARSASTQLKAKFASTLGSRAPNVVSGEANGQTVYRVRVGGYSQADAVAACTKIKAAGGGCFVTKQ